MPADNTRFLLQAARGRHEATTTRAQEALRRLDRAGSPVSFRAVAEAAGVSRAWLYRQPDFAPRSTDCEPDSPPRAGRGRPPRNAARTSPANGG